MWSDNETSIDQLGFQHLVTAVTTIVRRADLLPATIGVYGDWGSGKSSLLRMASAELATNDKALVLSFNGWVFEGYEDAKTALMGSILDGIAARKTLGPKAKERLTRLLKRVNWMRVLGAGVKYGAAFALAGPAGIGLAAATDVAAVAAKAGEKIGEAKLEEAEKFFREGGGEEARKTVREFRDDFEELLKETDIETLVVVIDDLDRCLPETIIETLEAIKLFLFVPKTAFVIGADERLVKYAVRRRFPELPGENVEVGRDYLEKLIQFPIHIPPLDAGELETFINLLFVTIAGLTPDQCEKARQCAVGGDLAAFSGVRFSYGTAQELFAAAAEPLAESMDLAQRIAPVLTAGLTGNPRQRKRFLNMLLMRVGMAASRKLTLSQPTLAKLMLLEYLKPEWFKQLAELQAAQDGRPTELAKLELLAKAGGTDAGSKTAERPKLSEEVAAWAEDLWMKDWLASEPLLATVDLRPYFYFSRDILGPLGGAVRRLPPHAQELLQRLLHDSVAERTLAAKAAAKLSPADAAAVLEALCERVSREDELNLDTPPLAGVLAFVAVRPELHPQLTTFLGRLPETRIPISLPVKLVPTKATQLPTGLKALLTRWESCTIPALAKSAKAALGRAK